MYFGKNHFVGQHVLHRSNGRKIDYVEQCVHLETTLYSDISISNITNAVNELFMRTNNLIADFSNAHSSTLSVLYDSYCMNVHVYWSQLIYIAWDTVLYFDSAAISTYTIALYGLFFSIFLYYIIVIFIIIRVSLGKSYFYRRRTHNK